MRQKKEAREGERETLFTKMPSPRRQGEEDTKATATVSAIDNSAWTECTDMYTVVLSFADRQTIALTGKKMR